MRPVSAAIVGLGYWGPHVLRNFVADRECRMLYGCDLLQANLERARARYPSLTYTQDTAEILKDPAVELVLIATPLTSHFDLAARALRAGKHVFVEKPLTETFEQAQTLVALAKEHERLLFVDHTFMFAPSVQKMANLVRDGSLGKLLYFDSMRINLGLIQKDTNVLYDLAIHDLSILSAFTDLSDITRVVTHGSKHFGTQEEVGHLHLQYRDGFEAHIHVSWLSPVKIRQTILAGSKAMVTYNDTEPSEKLRIYDRGVEHDMSKADPFFPKYRSGDIVIPSLPLTETLALETRHVLACIRGQEVPIAGGEEGAKALKILEAATRSMRGGGSPVTFP